MTVEVGSLEVLRGEGGVTPLSGPEKILVRSPTRYDQLDAERYPRITFVTDAIEKTTRLPADRDIEIHGTSRAQVVDLRTDDQGGVWWLSSETTFGNRSSESSPTRS